MQQLPQVNFANTGISVSKIGYGCMGLSAFYTTNALPSDDEAIELIGKALDQGVNFFDTARLYGRNEELLAKAIKKYGRNRFFLATKVPPVIIDENGQRTPVAGTSENIKKYCYESLKRLEVDYVDLYYMHRIDPDIPIEKQAQAFKELIEEGKTKFYGLSESSEDTIRRAHKIHPVYAVQEEYSLFTRDVENNGILKTCRELGITFVAYSPLGRGILTGTYQQTSQLDENDRRRDLPRFQEENLSKNFELVEKLKKIAKSLNITPGQLAIAWILSQGNNIIPIPGTKREKYLTENNQSAFVELKPEIQEQLSQMFPYQITAGDRYHQQGMKKINITTVNL